MAPRRGRVFAVTVGVAVLALASCTLLVDTDGLTGPEAGSEPRDGAGPSSEAAADGGIADSAPRAPCPADAFCDDFDDGGIGSGWTTVVAAGGNLTVADGRGRSLPAAARSLLLPGDASTDKRALLIKSFGDRTQLHCSFAFWIEKANADTDIASFTWKTEDGRNFFTWLDSYEKKSLLGVAFLPSGPYPPGGDLPLLPRGKWVEIDFRTDFTSIDVRFDGVLVYLAAIGNNTTRLGKQVTMTLGGLSSELEGNEFLYDDVLCE